MGKRAEDEICSSRCFLKPSLLCFAVFVFCLSFITYGLSPSIVTIAILFLSIIFIVTIRNKRVNLVDNPAQDQESHVCKPNSLLVEKVGEKLNISSLEKGTQYEATHKNEGCHLDEYQVESTDFPSDSDSSDDLDLSTSENFELNWMCSNNVDQNTDFAISENSENCVSDDDMEDDNLIEISLPNKTTSDDLEDEEPKQKLPSNLPDYLPESILEQQDLMELLTEIDEANEEENLIEIDLSMGSIK